MRSKGIDCAVEAIQHLRNAGVKISLRIAGTADPENPEHVPDETLEAWGRMPGVALVGRVCDISAFWAGVHIACLPSRGGEGLPRTLLEASACARPIVTTDAPGCADFVVPGETGLVVPRGDVVALAAALRRLCKDSALRGRMGLAGRSRVVGGYTEQHCAEQAASAWERLLAAPHWCG
ncbi:MAG: glycosyltransferase [Hyphomonadaceae bacterium]